MTLDEQMFEAAIHGKKVHVICINGNEYEGIADGYTQGNDEDDGYSTICIIDPRIDICLSENEIKSIEILD